MQTRFADNAKQWDSVERKHCYIGWCLKIKSNHKAFCLARLKNSMPTSSSKFKTSKYKAFYQIFPPFINHCTCCFTCESHKSSQKTLQRQFQEESLPQSNEFQLYLSRAAKAAGASKLKSSCSDFKGKVSMSRRRTVSYWTSGWPTKSPMAQRLKIKTRQRMAREHRRACYSCVITKRM